MKTNKDVIEQLKQLSKEAGSQAALAEKIKISTPYLSDVINGRRDPGHAILQFLGITKKVIYEPTQENKFPSRHRRITSETGRPARENLFAKG